MNYYITYKTNNIVEDFVLSGDKWDIKDLNHAVDIVREQFNLSDFDIKPTLLSYEEIVEQKPNFYLQYD